MPWPESGTRLGSRPTDNPRRRNPNPTSGGIDNRSPSSEHEKQRSAQERIDMSLIRRNVAAILAVSALAASGFSLAALGTTHATAGTGHAAPTATLIEAGTGNLGSDATLIEA